jgi:uncharacterized protein YndB with AHSA1/START domain
MSKPIFRYVTYIRTSPEKLWRALTRPEFTKQYWFGTHQESTWKPGSPWKLVFADGSVADAGEIVEAEAPTRLVIKWCNEFVPEIKADGYTRCTFEIEQEGQLTKLAVTHEAEADQPHKLIEAVSQGWPRVLSSPKSLLETGAGLPGTDRLPGR